MSKYFISQRENSYHIFVKGWCQPMFISLLSSTTECGSLASGCHIAIGNDLSDEVPGGTRSNMPGGDRYSLAGKHWSLRTENPEDSKASELCSSQEHCSSFMWRKC